MNINNFKKVLYKKKVLIFANISDNVKLMLIIGDSSSKSVGNNNSEDSDDSKNSFILYNEEDINYMRQYKYTKYN